ncbi:ABC transporter permease [Rathayibacter sp. CAU 1779]
MTTTLSPSAPASSARTQTRGPDAAAAGSERIHAALERIAHPATVSVPVIGAGILSWIAFSLVTWLVPDNGALPLRDAQSIQSTTPFTVVVGFAVAVIWAVIWALTATKGRVGAWATRTAAHGEAWLLGAGLWALFWEFSTAKAELLEPPYFVAPQEIFDRLWASRGILTESLANSMLLLAVGFAVGLVAGLLTGVIIGWSKRANYWVHPILIFIGPVPALAWVPIAFVLFPTAYTGAVFMIALTVWFPITILTRAGILSVPRSYFDVAQTLGAKTWYLVLRVSLPAALPSIFTGAFMALGASFVSLTIAENFGVNAGLGWYINWKKGWGDFPGVYAGIVVLVVVCGVLLTLLFRLRNYVLRWEKELTRW